MFYPNPDAAYDLVRQHQQQLIDEACQRRRVLRARRRKQH